MGLVMQWLLGFGGLLLFDLFVEYVLFESWNLNYTTRNDVFFIAWWVVVAAWAVFGLAYIYRHWK